MNAYMEYVLISNVSDLSAHYGANLFVVFHQCCFLSMDIFFLRSSTIVLHYPKNIKEERCNLIRS